MTTGAEPKKIGILAALLVVAALVLYFNVFSGDSSDSRPVAVTAVNPAPAPIAPNRANTNSVGERRRESRKGVIAEFKLRQGVEPGQDQPDPATIDPTLRLELLAKVQSVEDPGPIRNIFQYGAAPPPAAAAAGKPVELPKNTPKIPINQPVVPAGPPPPPPVPTAPPMTFKYYGYKTSKSSGRKEAFLLDGEDIIIAGENDALKRGRYKVISIGVNSITIEDMQFKSNQTLPLQEDATA